VALHHDTRPLSDGNIHWFFSRPQPNMPTTTTHGKTQRLRPSSSTIRELGMGIGAVVAAAVLITTFSDDGCLLRVEMVERYACHLGPQ